MLFLFFRPLLLQVVLRRSKFVPENGLAESGLSRDPFLPKMNRLADVFGWEDPELNFLVCHWLRINIEPCRARRCLPNFGLHIDVSRYLNITRPCPSRIMVVSIDQRQPCSLRRVLGGVWDSNVQTPVEHTY